MNETPYFKCKDENFIGSLERLRNAFEGYCDVKVGYSFKTNPHPHIIQLAKDNGCYAEVVSPHEYKMAKEVGFNDNRIIYNGVCKDVEQAVHCAESGGIVNIDNINELYAMRELATVNIKVGVRLTFDIGNGIVSRFGIPISSKDYFTLLGIDEHDEKISIVGLSCHVTHARNVEEWRKKANIMADCFRMFKGIEYIDLGGNMYSPMETSFKLNFPHHAEFEEYAEVVGHIIAETGANLILEAGTPLAANAMDLICTVVALKKNGSKIFIVTDASSYDLGFICRTTNISYHVVKCKKPENIYVSSASIVGYTCVEDDVLVKDFNGYISVADKIVFHNVGAYTLSFASNFIKPVPKVI